MAVSAQLFWPRGSILADFGTPENRPKWGFSLVKTAIFKKLGFFAFTVFPSDFRRVHRPAQVDLHTASFRSHLERRHSKLYSRFYGVGKLMIRPTHPLAPGPGPPRNSAKIGQNGQIGQNRFLPLGVFGVPGRPGRPNRGAGTVRAGTAGCLAARAAPAHAGFSF